MAPIDPDKAAGALLGLAVGEALYGPEEGTPATDLALRLGASLVAAGGYDPDAALHSYVSWYREDPPGIGDHLRRVLSGVDAGADAYSATSGVHFDGASSSGNGALARTTPIGVAFAGRDDALRDATISDAALTHFDPLAGKAALLHNQVLSWVLKGGPQVAYNQLKNPEWLDDRIEDVVHPAVAGVMGYAEALARNEPGSALASLAIALAAFFNADGFEPGLEWAVELGGDAGPNGAVTGALLGARLGAGAIPERWLEGLGRREEIGALGRQLGAMAG